MHNFTIGQRIKIKTFTEQYGTVKEVTNRKVKVLLDSTTTGSLSEYTLRNDNTFVAVGYSKDECNFGGFFYNNINS